MGNQNQFGQDARRVVKRVYYEGSDTIREGMALCYNQDTTDNWLGWSKSANAVGSTTAEGSQNEGKFIRVEQPATANMPFFAGFVTPASPNLNKSGPGLVDVYVPNGAIVAVRGTESFTIGDRLYIANGDYEVTNVPQAGGFCGIAMETVDRSSTEGLLLAKIHDTTQGEPSVALTAGATSLSPLIWNDVDLNRLRNDPSYGLLYETDFLEGVDATTGDAWTVTAATTGSIAGVIGVGGELHAAAGASTADQGVNAQLLTACVKPTANQNIYFEARVQVSHIDNQIFVGVASTDTTLIAAGVLDETNPSSVGFFTDANSATGVGGTVTQKAGANDTTEDIVTVAATTWTTLGFKITGVSTVEFYQDGVLIETGSTTANIADGVEMAFSVVCQNEDGANSNTLKVDWVKLAQTGRG